MTSELHHAAAVAIDGQRDTLAAATVADHFATGGADSQRYGARGREKCLEDAAYHLSFLRDAVATGCPSLFTDYIGWVKVLLTQLGIPAEDLAENLRSTERAIRRLLPTELADVAGAYIHAALRQLPHLPVVLPTCMADSGPLAPLAAVYLEALLRGDRRTASRLVLDTVEAGTPIKDIYLQVFQSSQYEIGRLWQMNEITVAQEHYCSAATQLIMSLLYPQIFGTEKIGHALVAACVQGDLHEIRIRIVSDFFELEGWDTFYLGANTPTAGILSAVEQQRAQVLALSATMTFHVRKVAEVIEAVRAAAACGDIKVLVGGYPFNVAPDLWQTIGADGCAPTAATAVSVANRLVEFVPS